MRKYLLNAAAVVFTLLLVGCQTSGPVSNVFSPYPPEVTLAQSVQDALMRSDDPVIAQVRVDADKNTVTLSGYVKKIRQSDTAEQIASKVPGVQMVENHIIVRQ